MRLSLSAITDSTIILYLNVRRVAFSVQRTWLYSLRHMYYGEEMRAKFISGLHQNHVFERENLQDIVNFPEWIKRGLYRFEKARQDLDYFMKEYVSFNAVIEADGLGIKRADHPILVNGKTFNAELANILGQLSANEKLLSHTGYKVLENVDKLKLVNFSAAAPLPDRFSVADVFDSTPRSNPFLLNELVNAYNRAQTSLNVVNQWLIDFIKNRNHKIIAGIAGTGKTHTLGYTIEQIDSQGDFVIFLNAKAFNGDNINFDNCFHQKLFVPQGYLLRDTLERLNSFARKKGKRLFIIFDALNETTTSTLGFSPIWEENLQNFINLVAQYPYLYFLSTLRTSYIEEIWPKGNQKFAMLKGVVSQEDTRKMCLNYFNYYKIDVDNLDTADVTLFSIPLLLDLFCKMTNGDRLIVKKISLGGNTYKQIFEGYIDQLVRDVRKKRRLMMPNVIMDGLHICSGKFMETIEGTLPLKEFVLSFDPDDMRVTDEKALAQPMLEGNLVFIKERIGPMNEIVKHTQQLIGGYLLATYLNNSYPVTADLLASAAFREKINGNVPDQRHQLRLDIIKFLVVYKPEIINSITDRTAFQEGWWYLYNGHDDTQPQLPQQLLNNPLSLEIIPYVLQISMARWIDPAHSHNFKFISKYLTQFGIWESDVNWTFYLYDNAELFFTFIDEKTKKLNSGQVDPANESVVALLIAFVNATTVRELRDRATVYLIEFGKLFPLELLDIAKQCAEFHDSYVYQRVIQALYGAVLIKQHDQQFIQEQLPVIAEALFMLQFATDATHPVYDYIVIDSIKHLLDLALSRGAWIAKSGDLANVSAYRVPDLPHWVPPTEEIIQQVNESPEMNPPDPIGMDFAIYTIPRLLDSGQYDLRTIAVSNVLKRVYELGFKREDNNPLMDNDRFKSYYYGHNLDREGKVDKLGKKYNWKALFDYAGYLLQRGELDTYQAFGDPTSGFKRLSDVGIDVSMPNPNYAISERFYFDELIPAGNRPEGWQLETKIETIEPHLVREFNGIQYVMLKGVVEQRIDQGYEVRSFIMVESCFIKKNEDFSALKDDICSQVFNWDRDLHLSPSYDSGVYFGEYYWADNQLNRDTDHYSVKTGKKIIQKRKVKPHDLFGGEYDFKIEDLNQERDFTYDEFLGFDGEATLIQYLNESNSGSFKGFSMYIPTAKMGNHLGLKADPTTGLILDTDLQPSLVTVDYEVDLIKNEGTYMRADLLKRYMDDHGYAIMYQNKQHSYDINSQHNRSMKYVVTEL